MNLSRGTIFVSLLTVGVVLLFLPHKYTRTLHDMFMQVAGSTLSIGPKTGPAVLNLDILSNENNNEIRPGDKELEDKYLSLKVDYANTLADLRSLNERYEKLAKIRSALPGAGPGLILAQVTNISLAGTRHELLINKGTDAGVEVGQYVMNNSSVIGSVVDTSKQTAKVKLVTDGKHNIEIIIMRKGKDEVTRGQLFGSGKATCKIPLISRDNDLRAEDIVYAAARLGFLDSPRMIGEISSIKPDEKKPLLWDIVVKPVYDADQIEEVTVVVMDEDKLLK